MPKTKKTKNKKRLTKRGKLFLANILCFVVIVIASIHIWLTLGNEFIPLFVWPWYVAIQCTFTFFSLIVYFLSIIADALGGRTAREKLSDGKTDAPEGNAEPIKSEEVK